MKEFVTNSSRGRIVGEFGKVVIKKVFKFAKASGVKVSSMKRVTKRTRETLAKTDD